MSSKKNYRSSGLKPKMRSKMTMPNETPLEAPTGDQDSPLTNPFRPSYETEGDPKMASLLEWYYGRQWEAEHNIFLTKKKALEEEKTHAKTVNRVPRCGDTTPARSTVNMTNLTPVASDQNPKKRGTKIIPPYPKKQFENIKAKVQTRHTASVNLTVEKSSCPSSYDMEGKTTMASLLDWSYGRQYEEELKHSKANKKALAGRQHQKQIPTYPKKQFANIQAKVQTRRTLRTTVGIEQNAQ